jgi:hypothetical protein
MPIRWVKPKEAEDLRRAMAHAGQPRLKTTAALDGLPPTLRAALAGGYPVHDPPLAARDEAVFLLQTAAEIEHALMVQYLYAAYSLKRANQIAPSDPDQQLHQQQVEEWRRTILNIAKEEMGHLMTVHNILLLLGGPPNFAREALPFKSDFYAFHFRLEPLTKESLAKYVLAERPEDPQHIYLTKKQLRDLKKHAAIDTGGLPVNRVGALYAALSLHVSLYLTDDDFLPPTSDISLWQAPKTDWDLDQLPNFHILVPTVASRQDVLQAINQVATQGEAGGGIGEEQSHFERFWTIYQDFPETRRRWRPSLPVAVNPNTLKQPTGPNRQGNIKNPRTRNWALVFNYRYRILLNYLGHYLEAGDHPDQTRDFIDKNRLVREMRSLGRVAAELTAMPRAAKKSELAGAPFELPFTLVLPARNRDVWRLHLYVHGLCDQLIDTMLPSESGQQQQLLKSLKLSDADRQILIAKST